MAIVLANSAKPDLLQAKLDIVLSACYLRLYKNNYTPVGAMTVLDFVEADFDGYTTGGEPLSSWVPAYTGLTGDAESTNNLISFGCTGGTTPNTIYGYYVVDGVGDIVYAERNPAGGQLIDTNGQTYSVLPKFVESTMP